MTLNKTFSWTAAVSWMALIFYLSHQPATESSELSTGITEVILSTVESIAPNLDVDMSYFNHIVRKNAHFFAYLTLGLLVLHAMRRSGVRGYQGAASALVIGVLYAISDEVHQLFIPGRSGEVRDVLIDSGGASAGIGLYLLVVKIKKMKKSR
ncbi:VanZ family protein [Salipaludibacillus neizhouensis]|uniref:VanZ family protein n=1 Tax=Salipaludibacillus neizhouensis TaxID=885475 RepID=A0A3A9KEY8_9BACI|nr:VanZ family protein [Salipaludibacillus neizhouensis]RKL68203.1 VanZ family protein [Salipaludibacillus neizhouensis]